MRNKIIIKTNINITILALASCVYTYSEEKKDIVADLVGIRLEFFQNYLMPYLDEMSEEEQAITESRLEYLEALTNDSDLLLEGFSKERFGEDVWALNESLKRALSHEDSIVPLRMNLKTVCPPIFWSVGRLTNADSKAAQILLRNYLVHVARDGDIISDERFSLMVTQQLPFVVLGDWKSPDLAMLLLRLASVEGEQSEDAVMDFLRKAWYTRPDVLSSLLELFYLSDEVSMQELPELNLLQERLMQNEGLSTESNLRLRLFNLLRAEGLLPADAMIDDPDTYRSAILSLER